MRRASLLGALVRRRKDPWVIVPYLGYGTPERLAFCGRVLEDEGFGDRGGRLDNLVSFVKRLESDEVPGALVSARYGGAESRAVTDREGYFHFELEPPGRLRAGMWHEVPLELAAPAAGAHATARVLVPSSAARFGVISDIDDTVMYSHVTSRVRMLLTVALSNARTRKPFKGVAAFYRALHASINPVFYVSKSPWNLYAPLLEFFELQGLPKGPLLLRDYGRHLLRRGEDHKTRSIAAILRTYPELDFVLIGDSGEHDPEIYGAIVRQHPGRIRVIYIRSVDTRASRLAAIARLATQLKAMRTQLVLAPDTELAAVHAAAEGLIEARDLAAIRVDRQRDQKSALAGGARRGA